MEAEKAQTDLRMYVGLIALGRAMAGQAIHAKDIVEDAESLVSAMLDERIYDDPKPKQR